jgi:uncharacterized membrane protein YccF (DUF307 family)
MANQVNVFSYATTNVANNAYKTLIASTTANVSQILVTDSSGALMKLAIGAAGSEVDIFQIPVSGTAFLNIPMSLIPMGSRVAIRSVDTASVTTGFNVLTLFQ